MWVFNAITFGLEVFSFLLLLILTAVVSLGVGDRFIFHYGWPWPEELGRYLLIWLTFLTSAIAARRGYHFVIDFFVVHLFKKRGARIHRVVSSGVVCIIFLLVIIKGWELTSVVVPQTSPALGISMGWVYGAIPISGAFIFLFFLVDAVETLRNPSTHKQKDDSGGLT